MAKAVMETRPEHLGLYWSHVWDNALASMKSIGVWDRDLRPLLDEYVFALIAADRARGDDEPSLWDKHTKRASALADQLALTPRGRKAVGVGDNEEAPPADAFEALERDELAQARNKRAS